MDPETHVVPNVKRTLHLTDFNQTRTGSQVLVNTSILDIMKIHSVLLDLFHADTHNVASTGTSQECICT